MEREKKVFKGLGIFAIVMIVLFTITTIAFEIYVRKYYKSDKTMLDAIAEIMEGSVNSYSDDNAMMFAPAEGDPKAVIIFYPGGKVEYTAYTPLLYKLADKGYLCVALKMPRNLAFLDVDAASEMMKKEQDKLDSISDLDWYIMGHSLGGVAASTYVKNIVEGKIETFHNRGPEGEYKGIIFCASYTLEGFTDDDIRLLSIYGSEDGVMNREFYTDSKKNWPKDSEEYIIQGGNHAYFGSYGEQDGDGEATITGDRQQDITAEVIDRWISEG